MPKDLILKCQNRVHLFLKRRLGWLPARIALAVMSWFGFMNLYMTRMNLSIAIVAMAKRNFTDGRDAVCVAGLHQETNNGTAAGTAEVQLNSTESPMSSTARTEYEEGEFSWDETTQGWILGAFYYGYMLTQVIGGRLAELYGSKNIFGVSVLGNGIAVLFSPLFARWHSGALIALRIVQGSIQGLSWPAMFTCISRWIPPIERASFVAIVCFANTLSTAMTLPLCGLIIANHGWEAQFYILGCLSLLYSCVWFAFMHNTPEEHPRISKEEETFIVDVIRENGTKESTSKKVPWEAIFTSWPVWAIFIFGAGNSWGITLFFTQLPTYMRNVLGFSIKSNGAVSAAPFLSRYFGGVLWSLLSSYLMSRKYLSVTNNRRLFTVISHVAPALVLVGLASAGCNATAAVTLLCLALFCNGALSSGGSVNNTDIAPNFAGTIQGLTASIDAGVGTIVPVINGFILQGQQTLEAWQKVFWVCVPIYIAAAIFTICFISGEVQPWNDIDSWNAKRVLKPQKSQDNVEEDAEERVHLKSDQSRI